jgi:hypothetical protein
VPVSVRVPIRLRLLGTRLDPDFDEVETAVGAAALRALARSRSAVIEPRGGYATVTCAAPRFTWRGDLARLSKATRDEIERRVTAALGEASLRAGLFDFEAARAEAPEVLPASIFEVIDPDRYDEDLELYWIPGYQKGGKRTQARVKGKKGSKAAVGPDEGVTSFIANFHAFASETTQEFHDTFGWKVSEYFGDRGVPNLFGVLYRLAGQAAPVFSLVEQSRGQVQRWRLFRFYLTLVPVETLRPVVEIDQLGEYRWIRAADPAGELVKWRASYAKKLVAHFLTGKAVKAGTEDATKKAAQARAEKMVADYSAGWEASHPEFYKFHHPDNSSVRYPIPKDLVASMPPSGYATIVPLAEKVEVVADAEESTQGQGPGGGKKKGPGGTGRRFKLAPGQIPGSGDGAEGGIGTLISREYARWPSRFPFVPSGQEPGHLRGGFTPVCEPFSGEPHIDTMPGSAQMWTLIQQIARLLEMEPCPYVANFAINAAKVLGGRVAQIGEVVSLDKAVFLENLSLGTTDDAGEVVFVPVPSPAVQVLRQLGAIVPLFDELFKLIQENLFPISDLIPQGHVRQDIDHALESAIVWIYLHACQISLLQALAASRENIQARLAPENFANYVQLTKVLLTTVGTDQVELIRLRDALNDFHESFKRVERKGQVDGGREVSVLGSDPAFASTWVEYWDVTEDMRVQPSLRSVEETIARRDKWVQLHEAMEGFKRRTDLFFRYRDLDQFVRGRAVRKDLLGHITQRAADAIWVIKDGKGVEWTIKDLNNAIKVRQSYLETTDPILNHIKFGTDVPFLAAAPDMRIEPFLRTLLQEMLEKNGEVRTDALEDPKWAFEHSKIEKPKDTVYYYGNQSGLHAMADHALQDAFVGTWRYGSALEHLYSHQVGWVSLRDTFLFVGIVALSVFCPPLGALAGLAEGIWRYSEAKDLESLYGALLEPGDIISRAEVEAQMFVARLGLAMAIIPVAGKITSVAARGVKTALSQGIRSGVRAALTQYLDDVALQMTRSIPTGLAIELAQMPVMMAVMEKLLEPMIEDLIRQIEPAMAVDLPESEQFVDPEDDN